MEMQISKQLRLSLRGADYGDENIIREIRGALLREGMEAASLKDLARSFCISSRTFSRWLNSLGTSFREIKNDCRKSVAAQKLTCTDVKIAEIGMTLGYSDSSNFTKAFKDWYGMTPQQFRSRMQSDARIQSDQSMRTH